MADNALLDRLRQGQVVLGLAHTYPAPGILESMGPGWDFVWIDAQHGQFSYPSVLEVLRTAERVGLQTLLRVPGHEPSTLGVYADAAPAAVMIPMVDTPEQARAIVRALRFPPLGERSYGGRRVYDLGGADYYRETELLVVAQIETPQAVENIEKILGVEGIDMLFFGADDLKIRLGLPMRTATADSRPLREALERIGRAARQTGKWAGCVAPTADSLKLAVESGIQLIAGGSDVGFLRTMASQQLTTLRTAANQINQPIR